MLFKTVQFMVRVLAAIFFRLEVVGFDRVPKEGGLMLVSNHSSFVDPPLVGCSAHQPLHTLAKAELFKIPILSHFLRYGCNAFPIKRGAVDRAAMRQCMNYIKAGEIVSLFPEGTRTLDGNLQGGKPGVAMIAVKAGVRCVPAYIDGAFRAWPRMRAYPLPSKIRIYYGEPFDLPERPEGMTTKDHYQLCADEMMRRIAELKPAEASEKPAVA